MDQTLIDHRPIWSGVPKNIAVASPHACHFTVAAIRANVWISDRQTAGRVGEEVTQMRGKKNPPLEFVPVAEGAPITYDSMAQAYLEE